MFLHKLPDAATLLFVLSRRGRYLPAFARMEEQKQNRPTSVKTRLIVKSLISLPFHSTLAGNRCYAADSMLATERETAILKRVLRFDTGDISPEAAKALLTFRFEESDQARMAELSERARQGNLSPAEQDELDGYIDVSHFLAFLQSKARISLRDPKRDSSAA
jgi:hypothetical protein